MTKKVKTYFIDMETSEPDWPEFRTWLKKHHVTMTSLDRLSSDEQFEMYRYTAYSSKVLYAMLKEWWDMNKAYLKREYDTDVAVNK